MFLSVQELELRKVHFDVTFPPGEIDFLDQRLRQVTPLAAEGSAELLGNTLGEIRVRGRLQVTIETECDRCLEAARFPVESNFDLFYRPAAQVHVRHASEEVEIDEGESEIAFYEGAGLELADILREDVLLSLPMQRICSQSCLGICPVCGQNRNVVHCQCRIRTVDERWAELKKLKRGT